MTNIKLTEEYLERQFEVHLEQLSKLTLLYIRQQVDAWKARFPKRTVHVSFNDGGYIDFIIDKKKRVSELTAITVHRRSGTRKKVLQELLECMHTVNIVATLPARLSLYDKDLDYRNAFDTYVLDEYGHAVLRGTDDTTDPYGHLSWCVGSDEGDFWCFDSLDLKDNTVALHAVVNSDTGGFIQDAMYKIVPASEALEEAKEMVGEAITWCAENGVRFDDVGHALLFLKGVQREHGGTLDEDDEKYYGQF